MGGPLPKDCLDRARRRATRLARLLISTSGTAPTRRHRRNAHVRPLPARSFPTFTVFAASMALRFAARRARRLAVSPALFSGLDSAPAWDGFHQPRASGCNSHVREEIDPMDLVDGKRSGTGKAGCRDRRDCRTRRRSARRVGRFLVVGRCHSLPWRRRILAVLPASEVLALAVDDIRRPVRVGLVEASAGRHLSALRRSHGRALSGPAALVHQVRSRMGPDHSFKPTCFVATRACPRYAGTRSPQLHRSA